jgi:uncharacterized protein YacL
MHNERDFESENTESDIKIKQSFYKQLFLIALAVFLGMFGYEFLKTYFLPTLSIWGSHFITIVFSTVLATLAAYVILKNRNELLDEVAEKRDSYKLALEKSEKSEEKYRYISEKFLKVSNEILQEMNKP